MELQQSCTYCSTAVSLAMRYCKLVPRHETYADTENDQYNSFIHKNKKIYTINAMYRKRLYIFICSEKDSTQTNLTCLLLDCNMIWIKNKMQLTCLHANEIFLKGWVSALRSRTYRYSNHATIQSESNLWQSQCECNDKTLHQFKNLHFHNTQFSLTSAKMIYNKLSEIMPLCLSNNLPVSYEITCYLLLDKYCWVFNAILQYNIISMA